MPQVRVIAAAIAVPLFAQADEPKPFHFAHDISPLLVKQACASAASPLPMLNNNRENCNASRTLKYIPDINERQ